MQLSKLLNRKLVVITSLILFPIVSWGQNLIGKVFNEDGNPLEYSFIAALDVNDSTLVSHASVDESGNFTVTGITRGDRIIQINLLGYKVFQKVVEVEDKLINLGTIVLEEQAFSINEVLVKAIVPVTIRKDTISFSSAAFKTRIDDTVEDLLKKLPGVEVDAAGKIKAYGEDVTKIYVDGKEFFSGDPTIAIKNLSAGAIKKIDVIDEKTDKSRLTSIQDFQDEKVINLILKDENKVNDFGSFQVGYGTNNRYLASLNYNRFTPKLQISVIGRLNNINSTGSDISRILLFKNSNSSTSDGFVTTGILGMNFGYEFRKDRDLNADYFYDFTDNKSGSMVTKRTEYINSDELYSENSNSNNIYSQSNKINYSYIDKSDTLYSVRFYGNLKSYKTDRNSNSLTKNYNSDNIMDMENLGSSQDENRGESGMVYLKYNRIFKEESSRNAGLRIVTNISKQDSKSSSTNLKEYINSNLPDELTVGSQEANSNSLDINASAFYDEPLTDNHILTFSGRVVATQFNESIDQLQTVNGADNPISSFESKMYERQNSVEGGVMYKYSIEKITIDIGGYYRGITQSFGDKLNPALDLFSNNYNSFTPSFRLRYKPKKGKLLYLRLTQALNMPGIKQLSPVENNFNPLLIVEGNQSLTPESNTLFRSSYRSFDFATGLNFYTYLSYSYSSNAIIENEYTDIETRVKRVAYENLGSKDNLSLNLDLSKRLNSLNLRYSVGFNGSISNSQSIINSELNRTISRDGTLNIGLENDNKESLDISIGAVLYKNITDFSIIDTKRDLFNQSYFLKSDWNITPRYNISSEFKYDLYRDSNFGTKESAPIWNASLSYLFLKSKKLNLKLSALDILDKSIGYSRSRTNNSYQETTKEVLGSYYMLSLTHILNGGKRDR